MIRISEHAAYPYVMPLLVWTMLSAGELIHPDAVYVVYPVKTFVAAFLVFKYWPRLPSFRPTRAWSSLGLGLFLGWIWLELYPLLVSSPRAGFHPSLVFGDGEITWASILFRGLGAVLVVPLIAEIFWRGFLMRYWIHSDFTKIPMGQFTPFSFLGTALLFTLAHGAEWAVALPLGLILGWWFVYTKNLGNVIIAHAAAHLLLAGAVLALGRWELW
jgi:uncharacterized protein